MPFKALRVKRTLERGYSSCRLVAMCSPPSPLNSYGLLQLLAQHSQRGSSIAVRPEQGFVCFVIVL